jgi:aminopeptidase N
LSIANGGKKFEALNSERNFEQLVSSAIHGT